MRGAEGCTDHRMVRTKLKLTIKPSVRRGASAAKIDVRKLKDSTKVGELRRELQECLTAEINNIDEPVTSNLLTERWNKVADALSATARGVLGTVRRRNRDWFDEQRVDIQILLEERNLAHARVLRNPSAENRTRYAQLRSRLQRELRIMENNWWCRLAEEIQGYADSGNQQQFYSALKAAYGAKKGVQYPVRNTNGDVLITERTAILERWAEHYRGLLNRQTVVDMEVVADFPELQTLHELDQAPSEEEVRAAINSLKAGKAAGPDGVPGDVLRCGGEPVVQCMCAFVSAAWTSGRVPQQWKDADIISIYKKKGDRALCGNSRGVSLLSSGGKVLARIILMRLIDNIAEDVLPESQCGFRRDRSTTDMVFVARQLQEKCIEQHRDLSMVFIDLTKAFDTVNRPLLWEVLRRFGCPPRLLAVVKDLHEGAMARVIGDGTKSDPFEVCTGVRQGCVIAPIIFNLFMAAVFSAAKRQMDPNDGVLMNYRLDGSLFNLRRLRAATKVEQESIIELQYADDAAVVGCTAAALQRNINAIEGAYTRAGLTINVDKTEALSMVPQGEEPTTFYVSDAALKNVNSFVYLGSVLNTAGNITDDVQRRIGLASAAFGRLAERAFLNRNLRTDTKVAVYKAVCLSILLYSSECWIPYRKHLKCLERFHTQCLQRILGIKWWHRVPHTEVRRRAGIDPLESILVAKQLRWAGHVRRMPANRLPRCIYYGELSEGRRSVGGQKKRHKDVLASHMRKCGISMQDFEQLANDRGAWRTTCAAGVAAHTRQFNEDADRRRARRHQPRAPVERHLCDVCGRVCGSRIGLVSHLRTHQLHEE